MAAPKPVRSRPSLFISRKAHRLAGRGLAKSRTGPPHGAVDLGLEFLSQTSHQLNFPTFLLTRSRARQFLVDYDPRSRAVEDYRMAGQELAILLQEQVHERGLRASA